MRKFIAVTVFLIFFSNHLETLAYEVNVHEQIAEKAINSSYVDQYLQNNLSMSIQDKFSNGNDFISALEWIKLGSNLEDDNATMRWLNHFFDPTTGRGLNAGIAELGEPSLIWGKNTLNNNEWDWAMARYDYYRALTGKNNNERTKQFSFVFRSLGQIIHLIHDLAVPAHVRNDPHGAPLLNYDMYEADAREKVDRGIPLKYDGYPAVDIAVFNDFHYFWARDGKGLAEFTNRNFLSRDTNFDNAAYSNYNYPVAIGEWTIKETVPDPFFNYFPTEVEIKYLQGYVTDNYRVETSAPISRLSAFSYFDFEMQKANKNKRVYSLNSKVHKEYSDFLIPRAVGYSSALLNYFFRGDIRLEYVTTPTPGYVIVNKSGEDLAGLFQIFYDNKYDQRVELMSGNFSLGKTETGGTFDIPHPADAKEPGKYTLVFRGKMGNESGAVAGYVHAKKLEITPPAQYAYAMIDAGGTAPRFTEIKVTVKNISGEAMQMGTLVAVAKYKKTTDDPDYLYSISTLKTGISLPPNTLTEYTFDFSGNPLPIGITDLYLEILFNGNIGAETGMLATGMKDISEPTPIDLFNNTDRSCINGSWYMSGSPEAISLVDQNRDSIPEWDIYGHAIKDIYIKISSPAAPRPASSVEHDFTVSRIEPGQFTRAIYILSEPAFRYSIKSSWEPLADSDGWMHLDTVHSFTGTAVRHQTDYYSIPEVCGSDSRCIFYSNPGQYEVRGNPMWSGGGLVYVNLPYPDGTVCKGY